MKHTISLNGTWLIDYLSNAPYVDTVEPEILLSPSKESATPCNVPGYWEDMSELFRTTTLHYKLQWNPLYTLQRYPQTGYCPDMVLPNPVGCFVYRKDITLDTVPDVETELSFGGVQNAVSAWINGHYLGRHEGYSAPFSFSIPKGILQVGENRITLAVSNIRLIGYKNWRISGLTTRAVNECTGGIYGDVEIRSFPDGLRDVWVTTAQDCSSFTVHTKGAQTHIRTVRIYDEETCLCTTEIAANQCEVSIDTDGYTYWSPDEPKLYKVVVSTASQELCCRFGIRRLTAKGTRLYLNGEPYYFRGVCEHCYQPYTVHPTRDKKYYRKVIKRLKELGFNSIRFHTWVPPYEYMEAADELGMLMQIDSPNNTLLDEWADILRFCRHYAAVNIYATGNELQIDDHRENHIRACAKLVHSETDSLFSPMSAMRGVEYSIRDAEYATQPFLHNPKRLATVGEYSDLYNSYSLGLTSYESASGDHEVLDQRNAIYGKPLLSHEICIHGTYIDLSLEERYRGLRIGDTEFMSSVRRHLADKGLLDRANLYYRNSAAWQQLLRKHCFETVRRCNTFAGYDFLGDIDTHWHTFGYCVGMMNEFYELKPGETVENVRRYNSDAVLLADLPACVNYESGSVAKIPILVSNYGKPIPKATLQIRVCENNKVLTKEEVQMNNVPAGEVKELYHFTFCMPSCEKPKKLQVKVSLLGGDADCENKWELYVFPKNSAPSSKMLAEQNTVVCTSCNAKELTDYLAQGKTVVLFGTGPFASEDSSYQISIAGRTTGHLATVIAEHPLMQDFPNDGYCGKQFEAMLNESAAVVLDGLTIPHRPIIDIATTYKNARREAMLFEYRVGNGKLLVCSLHLAEQDPAAVWLKNHILSYSISETFQPEQTLSMAQLEALCAISSVDTEANCNQAMNKNDITMNTV